VVIYFLYFSQKGCGKPVSALQRPAKLILPAIVPCRRLARKRTKFSCSKAVNRLFCALQ
jgi:hypothetical protein